MDRGDTHPGVCDVRRRWQGLQHLRVPRRADRRDRVADDLPGPALVARALARAFDPRLRKTERLIALAGGRGPGGRDGLLSAPDTRDTAWAWLTAHLDALMPLLPDRDGGQLPYAIRMCSRREIDQVRAFLAPRVEQLTGGPRNLAQALERAEQCVARVAAQRDSVIAYLGAQ